MTCIVLLILVYFSYYIFELHSYTYALLIDIWIFLFNSRDWVILPFIIFLIELNAISKLTLDVFLVQPHHFWSSKGTKSSVKLVEAGPLHTLFV